MVNIVEMILMGVVATLFMDLMAPRLAKMKIIRPLIGPEAVGRWILYMFRGKFIHADINEAPPLKHEKSAALVSHYLIGIVLAGIYLFLELKQPTMRHQLWMPLIFGLATSSCHGCGCIQAWGLVFWLRRHRKSRHMLLPVSLITQISDWDLLSGLYFFADS